ncbi:hypothetical protein KIPB_012788, partial [Kipferlia bialata]|eukprot:g12788.t1
MTDPSFLGRSYVPHFQPSNPPQAEAVSLGPSLSNAPPKRGRHVQTIL